mmetsp:Transcript_24182/g.33804  ORF Transcript_24182/g.33804 Transcript_24182/m.33804 type:complete len:241 (+) Transcript_24182:7-729(+)
MQKEKGKPTLSFDFTTGSDTKDDGFFWLNEPKDKEFSKGAGLRVVPDPKKTDFWRKTFRSPPADDTNGHALVTKVPKEANKWVGEVCFSIDPVLQYDQAGFLVYAGSINWIKGGIEFEEGAPQMSCVVTRKHSDWNYVACKNTKNVRMRIHAERFREAGLLECKVEYQAASTAEDDSKAEWKFLREAPIALSSASSPARGDDDDNDDILFGVMCCAPSRKKGDQKGMVANFTEIAITVVG